MGASTTSSLLDAGCNIRTPSADAEISVTQNKAPAGRLAAIRPNLREGTMHIPDCAIRK